MAFSSRSFRCGAPRLSRHSAAPGRGCSLDTVSMNCDAFWGYEGRCPHAVVSDTNSRWDVKTCDWCRGHGPSTGLFYTDTYEEDSVTTDSPTFTQCKEYGSSASSIAADVLHQNSRRCPRVREVLDDFICSPTMCARRGGRILDPSFFCSDTSFFIMLVPNKTNQIELMMSSASHRGPVINTKLPYSNISPK